MSAGRREAARDRFDVFKHGHRLLQIDDMDAIAGTKDVWLHLWVPAAGLVAKMHPGFQELFHGNFGHRIVSPWFGYPLSSSRSHTCQGTMLGIKKV